MSHESQTTDRKKPGPAKERILLHVCCAPCATHCINALMPVFEVELLFANPNIAPRREFDARLAEVERLARIHGLRLMIDPYDHLTWRQAVAGLEDEPERGARCHACFTENLRRAATLACEQGIPAFTTTLTVSPHKSSADIFSIGRRFAGFRPIDFKKRDGFRKSLELSRRHGLYRQTYCGCEFSLRDRRGPEDSCGSGSDTVRQGDTCPRASVPLRD